MSLVQENFKHNTPQKQCYPSNQLPSLSLINWHNWLTKKFVAHEWLTKYFDDQKGQKMIDKKSLTNRAGGPGPARANLSRRKWTRGPELNRRISFCRAAPWPLGYLALIITSIKGLADYIIMLYIGSLAMKMNLDIIKSYRTKITN